MIQGGQLAVGAGAVGKMADGDGWQEVRRGGGRVHGPRDTGGGGGGRRDGAEGRGAGVEGGAGDQGGGVLQQPRARAKAPDIRARVEPKPHTVMLNCRKFAVLPTKTEVADWFGDHLFTQEVTPLLGRVAGLDIEEREKRIMVQLGSDQDVDMLLTRMGEEGVAWPVSWIQSLTNQSAFEGFLQM